MTTRHRILGALAALAVVAAAVALRPRTRLRTSRFANVPEDAPVAAHLDFEAVRETDLLRALHGRLVLPAECEATLPHIESMSVLLDEQARFGALVRGDADFEPCLRAAQGALFVERRSDLRWLRAARSEHVAVLFDGGDVAIGSEALVEAILRVVHGEAPSAAAQGAELPAAPLVARAQLSPRYGRQLARFFGAFTAPTGVSAAARLGEPIEAFGELRFDSAQDARRFADAAEGISAEADGRVVRFRREWSV
ncbi:MAG: hypothetical protein AAF645_21720, partial [Myxococcota bacterium]